ncbi:MAG: FHA domain-containing protein [Fuerstiella sp.]
MISSVKLISDIFDIGYVEISAQDLPVILGRSERADITINDGLLSRLHSEIRLLPIGSLEVRDLDSTNLTIVNEVDVSQSILQDGDVLLVGDTRITIGLEFDDDESMSRTTRDLTIFPGPADETVAD